MPKLAIALLLALALTAAACASAPAAAIETLEGDAPFDVSGAPEPDVAAIVDADTRFALDLLALTADGGNTFLSPLSITTALGMTSAGARGETRAEMARVLHETLADERLHPARGALLAEVNAVDPLPDDADGEPLTLRAVNSVWLQQGYPVLSGYLDVLSSSYNAPAYAVDFVGDTEAARRSINEWVSEQTEERIDEMLPEGSVSELTRLVLTNAVYFLGSWMDPFDPAATVDEPFTPSDGSAVTVPFMHRGGELPYLAGDGFQAVRLPYWGGASMVLMLPEGSPQDLLAMLDVADLSAIDQAPRTPFADLALPRFEFESDLGLNDALRELGMATAFEPPSGDAGADFTGITEVRELFVSDVLHKAFVSVDEAGTEAAAATAVVIGVTSAPIGEPIELRFDRPFVFFIEHDATGAILFAGVVENPAG
ncbi:MAG: serpin family protein [Acidimicrobiia bacterium]|jgi:serpin B